MRSYVNRKKNGGRQSNKDKKGNNGRRPQSAGASIRRFNEEKHRNEIKDVSLFHEKRIRSHPSILVVDQVGCICTGCEQSLYSCTRPSEQEAAILRRIPFVTRPRQSAEHPLLNHQAHFLGGASSVRTAFLPLHPRRRRTDTGGRRNPKGSNRSGGGKQSFYK